MNTIRQDLIYGLRMLVKKPVFTLVASLSLALGIGLNTAIFTLINSMLWGQLPYRAEDRLAVIWSVSPQHLDRFQAVSLPDYVAFRDRNRSFEMLVRVSRRA